MGEPDRQHQAVYTMEVCWAGFIARPGQLLLGWLILYQLDFTGAKRLTRRRMLGDMGERARGRRAGCAVPRLL